MCASANHLVRLCPRQIPALDEQHQRPVREHGHDEERGYPQGDPTLADGEGGADHAGADDGVHVVERGGGLSKKDGSGKLDAFGKFRHSWIPFRRCHRRPSPCRRRRPHFAEDQTAIEEL